MKSEKNARGREKKIRFFFFFFLFMFSAIESGVNIPGVRKCVYLNVFLFIYFIRKSFLVEREIRNGKEDRVYVNNTFLNIIFPYFIL